MSQSPEVESLLASIPVVRRRHRAGEVLFHAGDTGESAFVVTSGLLGMEVGCRHREPLIAELVSRGDVAAADRVLMPNTAHRTTARALLPTEVRIVRHSDVEAARVGELARRALTPLVVRANERLLSRVAEATHLSARARVATALIRLAGEIDEIAVSQETIGAVAGVVRATANAELRLFAEAGHLTLGRRRTTIIDRAAIERAVR